jgi:broad specificity phosphatase PhoE
MILASVLDLPTDKFQNFVIEPASISIVQYESKSKTIVSLNQEVEGTTFRQRFTSYLLGGDNA